MILTIDANIAFVFDRDHRFWNHCGPSGSYIKSRLRTDSPCKVPSTGVELLPYVGCVFSLEDICYSSSSFFFSYIILQGLSGTAAGFLQIVPLISYYAKLFILGSTPRSVYNIKYNMRNVAWGTLFPSTTLLAVISASRILFCSSLFLLTRFRTAITYSVISPIINGLACFTFFVFYLLWKYLFLYQLDQPASGDTGGIFFPKAIQHVFVGLYIQQICLAALFFLAQNANKKQSAIPEGALMIVLIVVTVRARILHCILKF